MKYYELIVELGHVDSGHSIETKVYIKAKSLMQAMDIGRGFGGIKHTKIPNVREITKEEYESEKPKEKYRGMVSNIFGG